MLDLRLGCDVVLLHLREMSLVDGAARVEHSRGNLVEPSQLLLWVEPVSGRRDQFELLCSVDSVVTDQGHFNRLKKLRAVARDTDLNGEAIALLDVVIQS